MLIESSSQFGLNTVISYYAIDLTNVEQLNSTSNLKPSCLINLEVFTKNTDTLLENATVTSTKDEDACLIVFFNSMLSYFDLKTSKLIFTKDLSQHDFNKEYFLSPTNLITNKLNSLTPIVNSHNFVALNNSDDLMLMSFNPRNSNNRLFSQIKSGAIDCLDMKFESFRISKDRLVAFNRLQLKLIGFNLNQVLESNSFDKSIFTISTNKNLNLYGFSSSVENVFTVENKKVLKLYDCPKNKTVAEIPLYSETNLILCSTDFMVLAMKDNRIISYLICDGNTEESFRKIKQLKSRFDIFNLFYFLKL